MATVVFLHAHPDDEASQTSGTMARLVSEGHRVVTVYGTGGEHGEVPDDLAEGETLADRRRIEAEASAAVLGVSRVAWLGYTDSGMTGWEQNAWDGAFAAAPVDEAAGRLAAVLDEEGADVVVGYDWHGGYGHPDHVKVHGVVHAAGALAARPPRVLESTMNRDHMRAGIEAARAAGMEGLDDFDPDRPMDDGNPLGEPESAIHWQVDTAEFIQQKRAALACHRSQKTDIEGFLSMPEEAFAQAFRFEHFVEAGRPAGMVAALFVAP